MNKKETGKTGEQIAGLFLAQKGYTILARNHKERFDEIDIIARHPKGALVFCEVKTVNYREDYFGGFMPEDSLSPMKLKKITRGSMVFLARHPELVTRGDSGWQIDLVAIVLRDGRVAGLRHYENI